jgi:hypothetical protein
MMPPKNKKMAKLSTDLYASMRYLVWNHIVFSVWERIHFPVRQGIVDTVIRKLKWER